jgi:hypothetical protein
MHSGRLAANGELGLLLHRCNDGAFFLKPDGRARFRPHAEKTLARISQFRGMAMSELIVLVSCGAAFVTGLVIAGMSLIG